MSKDEQVNVKEVPEQFIANQDLPLGKEGNNEYICAD